MSEAWIGLVGAVVGAVIAHGFDLWREKGRWKREDRLRFLDRRRELYAEFLVRASERAVLGRTLGSQRMFEFGALLYEVRLIGSAGTKELASKIHTLLSKDPYEGRTDEMRDLLNEFTKLAASEFGE